MYRFLYRFLPKPEHVLEDTPCQSIMSEDNCVALGSAGTLMDMHATKCNANVVLDVQHAVCPYEGTAHPLDNHVVGNRFINRF